VEERREKRGDWNVTGFPSQPKRKKGTLLRVGTKRGSLVGRGEGDRLRSDDGKRGAHLTNS